MSVAPTDEQILEAVTSWVEVLTSGDYGEALAVVHALPHWTADLLERVITNYGNPSRPPGPHRVTSPARAQGAGTHAVDRFANGVVEAWYDLPLDGEWSDLTATLLVRNRGTDSVLELQDVHIM